MVNDYLMASNPTKTGEPSHSRSGTAASGSASGSATATAAAAGATTAAPDKEVVKEALQEILAGIPALKALMDQSRAAPTPPSTPSAEPPKGPPTRRTTPGGGSGGGPASTEGEMAATGGEGVAWLPGGLTTPSEVGTIHLEVGTRNFNTRGDNRKNQNIQLIGTG